MEIASAAPRSRGVKEDRIPTNSGAISSPPRRTRNDPLKNRHGYLLTHLPHFGEVSRSPRPHGDGFGGAAFPAPNNPPGNRSPYPEHSPHGALATTGSFHLPVIASRDRNVKPPSGHRLSPLVKQAPWSLLAKQSPDESDEGTQIASNPWRLLRRRDLPGPEQSPRKPLPSSRALPPRRTRNDPFKNRHGYLLTHLPHFGKVSTSPRPHGDGFGGAPFPAPNNPPGNRSPSPEHSSPQRTRNDRFENGRSAGADPPIHCNKKGPIPPWMRPVSLPCSVPATCN